MNVVGAVVAHDAGLERGCNAMTIWQDLVTDHGFAGKYASVMR